VDKPQSTPELDNTIPDVVEAPKQKMGTPKAKKEAQPAQQSSVSPLIKYGAIGAIVLLLAIAGIFLFNNTTRSNDENTNTTAGQTINTETAQPALEEAQEPTQSIAPATDTDTPEPPTATPTETPVPLTATPSTPYVLITGIRLENNIYVVDYEVHNFPESANTHVHMFFNTVPPEQAGSPASGPWKLTWGPYGNPPFTQYGTANRPANATQMCALVANPNHSVILESGNCFDLPE
jgi:hypothetical protein